jgi:hypothetical protein
MLEDEIWKKLKNKEKKQVSTSEPYKPELNSQIHNSLNSQPKLNLRVQYLKI